MKVIALEEHFATEQMLRQLSARVRSLPNQQNFHLAFSPSRAMVRKVDVYYLVNRREQNDKVKVQ